MKNGTAQIDTSLWKPTILRSSNPEDHFRLKELRSTKSGVIIHDEILSQIRELVKTRNPTLSQNNSFIDTAVQTYIQDRETVDIGVWVWYEWENRLVHLLGKEEFVELRCSRNQMKITKTEQNALGYKKIGIVGLSVGQSIALTLTMERGCGTLRLADFDTLELSNMNRIRTAVYNLGLPKVVIAAREIASIDPFLQVEIFPEGINSTNMDEFFLKNGKLDLVFDECDSLDVKLSLRHYARQQGVPVLMETNDRGMMDVERFDLDPNRPLLHNLVGDLTPEKLFNLNTAEKVPFVHAIVGKETLSPRMKQSMPLIGQQLVSWPQLASSVALGGALGADVSRRILLDQFRDSGRYYIDLEELICDKIQYNKSDKIALKPEKHPSEKKIEQNEEIHSTYIPITIRAFCAVDEPETCIKFIEGHQKRLNQYGIHQISSLLPDWCSSSGCTVIVAETECGEILGGVRIEKHGVHGHRIPLAKAVGSLDDRLELFIQQNGVAEMCGIWVSDTIQGGEIKHALNTYGLSIYPSLDITMLLGFSAPHMLKYLKSLGWEVETHVGHQGIFEYPSAGIQSSIVKFNLSKCPIAERRKIIAVRSGLYLPYIFTSNNDKKYQIKMGRIQTKQNHTHLTTIAN